MEKLSIIVPVFNIVNYLEECINSLIIQDYDNCEIIVVDDGSTDGSSQLCDLLQKKDNRISVIHQKNQGLSGARNTGLSYAKGYYLCFIDSDDYVSPNMFSKLINELELTGSDVAICNFEIFNKVERISSKRYGYKVVDYSNDNQVIFYAAALDSSCNRVFKASSIRNSKLSFEHKSIVAQEDYWFQVRLFSHINRIVTIEDNLYHYRERGSSITKSHSDGDITERNKFFYARAEEYIKQKTNRKVNSFMEYLLVNLFTASINNASAAKPKVLLDILFQYEMMQRFKAAISSKSIRNIFPGKEIRRKYTRFSFALIRIGFNRTFSVFESLRLKRLRSNTRTSLYYD